MGKAKIGTCVACQQTRRIKCLRLCFTCYLPHRDSRPGRVRSITASQERAAARLYGGGMSRKEVAAKLGITTNQVKVACRNLKVTRYRINPADCEAAVKAAHEADPKATLRQIARMTGWGRNAVRLAAKRLGIKSPFKPTDKRPYQRRAGRRKYRNAEEAKAAKREQSARYKRIAYWRKKREEFIATSESRYDDSRYPDGAPKWMFCTPDVPDPDLPGGYRYEAAQAQRRKSAEERRKRALKKVVSSITLPP